MNPENSRSETETKLSLRDLLHLRTTKEITRENFEKIWEDLRHAYHEATTQEAVGHGDNEEEIKELHEFYDMCAHVFYSNKILRSDEQSKQALKDLLLQEGIGVVDELGKDRILEKTPKKTTSIKVKEGSRKTQLNTQIPIQLDQENLSKEGEESESRKAIGVASQENSIAPEDSILPLSLVEEARLDVPERVERKEAPPQAMNLLGELERLRDERDNGESESKKKEADRELKKLIGGLQGRKVYHFTGGDKRKTLQYVTLHIKETSNGFSVELQKYDQKGKKIGEPKPYDLKNLKNTTFKKREKVKKNEWPKTEKDELGDERKHWIRNNRGEVFRLPLDRNNDTFKLKGVKKGDGNQAVIEGEDLRRYFNPETQEVDWSKAIAPRPEVGGKKEKSSPPSIPEVELIEDLGISSETIARSNAEDESQAINMVMGEEVPGGASNAGVESAKQEEPIEAVAGAPSEAGQPMAKPKGKEGQSGGESVSDIAPEDLLDGEDYLGEGEPPAEEGSGFDVAGATPPEEEDIDLTDSSAEEPVETVEVGDADKLARLVNESSTLEELRQKLLTALAVEDKGDDRWWYFNEYYKDVSRMIDRMEEGFSDKEELGSWINGQATLFPTVAEDGLRKLLEREGRGAIIEEVSDEAPDGGEPAKAKPPEVTSTETHNVESGGEVDLSKPIKSEEITRQKEKDLVHGKPQDGVVQSVHEEPVALAGEAGKPLEDFGEVFGKDVLAPGELIDILPKEVAIYRDRPLKDFLAFLDAKIMANSNSISWRVTDVETGKVIASMPLKTMKQCIEQADREAGTVVSECDNEDDLRRGILNLNSVRKLKKISSVHDLAVDLLFKKYKGSIGVIEFEDVGEAAEESGAGVAQEMSASDLMDKSAPKEEAPSLLARTIQWFGFGGRKKEKEEGSPQDVLSSREEADIERMVSGEDVRAQEQNDRELEKQRLKGVITDADSIPRLIDILSDSKELRNLQRTFYAPQREYKSFENHLTNLETDMGVAINTGRVKDTRGVLEYSHTLASSLPGDYDGIIQRTAQMLLQEDGERLLALRARKIPASGEVVPMVAHREGKKTASPQGAVPVLDIPEEFKEELHGEGDFTLTTDGHEPSVLLEDEIRNCQDIPALVRFLKEQADKGVKIGIGNDEWELSNEERPENGQVYWIDLADRYVNTFLGSTDKPDAILASPGLEKVLKHVTRKEGLRDWVVDLLKEKLKVLTVEANWEKSAGSLADALGHVADALEKTQENTVIFDEEGEVAEAAAVRQYISDIRKACIQGKTTGEWGAMIYAVSHAIDGLENKDDNMAFTVDELKVLWREVGIALVSLTNFEVAIKSAPEETRTSIAEAAQSLRRAVLALDKKMGIKGNQLGIKDTWA